MNINVPTEFDELLSSVKIGLCPRGHYKNGLTKEFLDIDTYIYADIAEGVNAIPLLSGASQEDLDQMWSAANDNTKETIIVNYLGAYMNELLGIDYDWGKGAVVMTNKNGFKGASAILYPEYLDKAAEMVGCDHIAIMPSSIHEVIVIPYDGSIPGSAALEMVASVNKDLKETEVLSDSVYLYDTKTKNMQLL